MRKYIITSDGATNYAVYRQHGKNKLVYIETFRSKMAAKRYITHWADFLDKIKEEK